MKDTLNFSVSSSDGTATISGSQAEVGTGRQTIDLDLPAGSVNYDYAIAFSYTSLQSIVLLSNKNMTIKVNSTGSPILTINLIANTPYIWQLSSGYWANPFTANVTHFYCSCTPAANLKGKILTA